MTDHVSEFLAAMEQHGLVPTEPIRTDGKLHRFHVEGDPRGKRNGFYTLHLDGRPAGHFGCHKRGVKEDWKATAETMNGNGAAPDFFNDADRAEMLRKIAENARRKEEEQAAAHLAKAKEAASIWSHAKPAPADHPYLVKKGVRPHGAMVDDAGKLVLAMADAGGTLWSLQKIDADGAKRFLPGGRKRGCMFWIGEPGERIVVAEGFATAGSVHEATGLPVAVAFDCVNLQPVAKALREKWPGARIVIAADDDRKTDGNPGVTKARAAARAISASVAVPVFKEPDGRTDFNDLALAEGAEAVAAIITAAFEQPEPEVEETQAGEAEATEQHSGALAETLAEMNQKHFVAKMGARVGVAFREVDPEFGNERIDFVQRNDIKLFYGNRRFPIGSTKEGGRVYRDLGSIWLEHRDRPTYRRIALIPSGPCPSDTYNLWRGFGVAPKPGSWRTIEAHLREVICAGIEAYYQWLLIWLAHCVQNPGKPAEVAAVMRGLKGSGKGLLARMLMRIFRGHSMHISKSKHLIGNFNAHLLHCLFLFVDEAFWAGDKASEGALQTLITEPTLLIEPKGIDSFQVPNRLKVLKSSNNEWVVPTSADERRYFVLDVSSHRMGDKEYFAALVAAIEGDELAAMLHDLLAMNLGESDHRDPPHTAGLNKQKILGADSVQKFWFDCLTEGYIVGGDDGEDWPDDVVCQVMHAAYLEHAKAHGERYPATIEQMSAKLRAMCPGEKHERLRPIKPNKPWGDDPRPRRYRLGSLEEHRAAFLKAMNIDSHEWPEAESGQ